MLTVHHLGISQSERIVWLCEELGVPYELKRYDRDATTKLAPAEYRALHPIGTAPIITDGDVVLPESGAIIEYIIGKYGNGRLTVKPEQSAYADYLFWFHFANASMMANEMMNLVASRMTGGDEDPILQSLRGRSDKAYAYAEQRLGQTPYFAGGEFTAADIIMLFPLTTLRLFAPRNMEQFPNIVAYLKRIGERPAYKAAMAKSDPGLPSMTG